MKFLCCLIFMVTGSLCLFSQDLVLTPIGETPCMPGVLGKSRGKGIVIEHGGNSTSKLLSGTDPKDASQIRFNSRFKSKIKIPILNKPALKLMVGWNYYREEYQNMHLSH